MAKSAYVKVSSPANIGGVMTECQVTVKSHPESNNLSDIGTRVPAIFTPDTD